MKFKTHQEIDDYYRKQGLDIDTLNKEFEETKSRLQKAIQVVKARKFLKGIFYDPFEGFGRLKPEVEEALININ